MSGRIVAVFLILLALPSLAFARDFDLSDRLADLEVDPAGNVIVDGEAMTADAFLAEVARRQNAGGRRGAMYQLLDITGPFGIAWVAIGLAGQVLFTGRMIVQWLASEKAKQSVVPPAFWWMSFLGATMLLAYFTWRVDVVGILGQVTGWFIYVRNLWLIYRPPIVSVQPE